MEGYIPPRSGFGLIQEDLWPDKWKIIVSCMMLNCTSRKQVEKVIPRFFSIWPTPTSLANANLEDVSSVITPLGFKNRRAKNLINMSKAYINPHWKSAYDLPGIGEYAARAVEIFCLNILGEEPPKDGALVVYWKWRKKHGS